MIPLYLYGSGGHAREIFELVRCVNGEQPRFEFLGWIDDDPALSGSDLKGHQILDRASALKAMPVGGQVVVAVGTPASRRRIAMWVEEMGIASPVLVHPRAWVGRDVVLGAGTQVAAGAMISTDIEVGRHVIVNQGCTVAHDVRMGDFANLAPGARLSGAVTVEEGADVGTGAVVIQGLSLGAWCIVGAGAAIVRDVPANTTVVGVPAKVIKQRNPGWHDAPSDTVS